MTKTDTKLRKRPVTLTVRSDLLKDAKDFHLNASQAAEDGIALAVKKAKEEQWLAENKEAIEYYNKRIETEGLLVRPYWLNEDNTINEDALLNGPL